MHPGPDTESRRSASTPRTSTPRRGETRWRKNGFVSDGSLESCRAGIRHFESEQGASRSTLFPLLAPTRCPRPPSPLCEPDTALCMTSARTSRLAGALLPSPPLPPFIPASASAAHPPRTATVLRSSSTQVAHRCPSRLALNCRRWRSYRIVYPARRSHAVRTPPFLFRVWPLARFRFSPLGRSWLAHPLAPPLSSHKPTQDTHTHTGTIAYP